MGSGVLSDSCLTLAVTSSTAVVGVALTKGASVMSERHCSTDRRHAEELTPMIRDVLAEAGVALHDLDRFAVDVGPGRFTGLRVGIASIRTLAFAVDKPVVGVSSLAALAATQPGRCVTAVIDARRAEVFQQRFVAVEQGGHRAVSGPAYGPPEVMVSHAASGDVVVGDGADRYVEVYGSVESIEYVANIEPLAVNIARLSLDLDAVPGSQVVPLYLRDPDVQVNIKTRHNT